MGKVIFFITSIVFIYILLIGTGQLCVVESGNQQCGLSSIVFNGITNIANFEFSTFFTEIIGDVVDFANSGTGFSALLVGVAVAIGAFLLTSSDTRLFVPIGLTLGLIAGDFVFLFNNLGINPLLSTFIIAPLMIAFTLSVLDWMRGKD